MQKKGVECKVYCRRGKFSAEGRSSVQKGRVECRREGLSVEGGGGVECGRREFSTEKGGLVWKGELSAKGGS